MKKEAKHIHFIGIAGSAIAQLAVMMKQKGWKVTGSEHNKVWEPMKSFLSDNDIKYTELNYNLEDVRNADLIILGGSALLKDPNHPEYIEAKKLGKRIEGYAYLVGKYISADKSIVVTGSYGKSTTASILAWILIRAGSNPSYMIGGKVEGLSAGVKIGSGEVSVCEGDEYASVWGYDMEPRFLSYKPTHAIITSAEWDHIDVYNTLDSYIAAYVKLAKMINKKQGSLLVNAAGENLDSVLDDCEGEYSTYLLSGEKPVLSGKPTYLAKNLEFDSEKTQTRFVVDKNNNEYEQFASGLIGRHNVENCLAAIAMADSVGVAADKIAEGIRTFPGLKRRLEIIGSAKSGAVLIDDFAHSPVKAQATITALKDFYPDKKVIAVYFPRTSLNQNRETLNWYPGAFDGADDVIIPRVDVQASTPRADRVYGIDIVESIAKSQPNVRYIPINENLIKYLKENSDENSIIVFMSSTGIDWAVQQLI
ncbi:hypothetical protein GF357_04495 [Candidatus Dojkabacteria bacterium]|nr:hypothetical protein [Candidatus Dojkabacteria bacterium]